MTLHQWLFWGLVSGLFNQWIGMWLQRDHDRSRHKRIIDNGFDNDTEVMWWSRGRRCFGRITRRIVIGGALCYTVVEFDDPDGRPVLIYHSDTCRVIRDSSDNPIFIFEGGRV